MFFLFARHCHANGVGGIILNIEMQKNRLRFYGY